MLYLLDTSIIIEHLRGNQTIRKFISSHPGDEFSTSCICEAEIYEGIYQEKTKQNFEKHRDQLKELFTWFNEVLKFDSIQAEIAGKIRASLSKDGQLIGDLDILIASAAISKQATLWTKNPKHFFRIKELQILFL